MLPRRESDVHPGEVDINRCQYLLENVSLDFSCELSARNTIQIRVWMTLIDYM